MKISLFGVGYVGCVTAACLGELGNHIICYDCCQNKLDKIKQGKVPVYEQHLDYLIQKLHENEQLSCANNINEAVNNSELSIICVGTPSNNDGFINYKYLVSVTESIGKAIADKNTSHTVIYRSTMFPGTIESMLIPLLEQSSGKKINKHFNVYYYPEFLREGTAVSDYLNPTRIIIGGNQRLSEDYISELFPLGHNELINFTTFKSSEMIKYVDNSWHALKVSYANEIGVLCHHFGIDSVEVMKLFKLDNKLNISEHYLNPGFAFGGSCLPKELRTLEFIIRQEKLSLPLINSILSSNNEHIDRVLTVIEQLNPKSIGISGLTFKENTKDIRESPSLIILQKLLTNNYKIKVYDNLLYEDIMNDSADNSLYIDICNLKNIMVKNISDLFEQSDVVILLHDSDAIRSSVAKIKSDVKIIDLKLGCMNLAQNKNYITIV